MIKFRCPDCGTSFEFRKRVTLTKRYCPHCNYKVDVADIDEQVAQKNRDEIRGIGCLISGLFMIILPLPMYAIAPAGYGILFAGVLFLFGVFIAYMLYTTRTIKNTDDEDEDEDEDDE